MSAFLYQVADLFEERGVFFLLERLALARQMIPVDLILQLIAFFEQDSVPWAQIANNRGERLPKFIRINARAGRNFVAYQIIELFINSESAYFNRFCHCLLLFGGLLNHTKVGWWMAR